MATATKIKPAKNTDDYIASFREDKAEILEKFRATIKKAAPGAEEVISYGIPAFKKNGLLVWFAGHNQHIGFYPRVSAIEAFKKELAAYKGSKGSVQFPFDKPMPWGLVTRIVKFRVKENLEKLKKKK